MKIVFWGGPLDGEVCEIPKLMPIRVLQRETRSLVDYGRTDIVGDPKESSKTFVYLPRQLYATAIAQRLGSDGSWWVMAPADASDFEMLRHLNRHSTPVVDGPVRRGRMQP